MCVAESFGGASRLSGYSEPSVSDAVLNVPPKIALARSSGEVSWDGVKAS